MLRVAPASRKSDGLRMGVLSMTPSVKGFAKQARSCLPLRVILVHEQELLVTVSRRRVARNFYRIAFNCHFFVS